MIHYEKITKSYLPGVNAVADFTLSVAAGELLAIIGPSGCGKTTVLKMLNRLVEPSSGRILLHGEDIRTLEPTALRRSMGYVIQQVGLFPHMTILENITVVPDILGWPLEKQRARAHELLELIDMKPAEFSHRYPYQLSGGQQQRVAIARALAMQPKVLLCDEITSALDPELVDEVLEVVKRLADDGMTLIMVTHEMRFAREVGDTLVFMHQGKVHEMGPPRELFANPQTPELTSFVKSVL